MRFKGGKYKDKLVSDVIKEDPSYILGSYRYQDIKDFVNQNHKEEMVVQAKEWLKSNEPNKWTRIGLLELGLIDPPREHQTPLQTLVTRIETIEERLDMGKSETKDIKMSFDFTKRALKSTRSFIVPLMNSLHLRPVDEVLTEYELRVSRQELRDNIKYITIDEG